MFIDKVIVMVNTDDVLGKCCRGPDVQITSVVKLLNFSILKCNEKYIYTLYICVNIFHILRDIFPLKHKALGHLSNTD